MSFDKPDGFVIVPLGKDAQPMGIALWVEDEGEAARVYFAEANRNGAYLLHSYRASKRPAHAAE